MAKFCKNCGNPLNENDKFCNSCGTPLTGAAPAAPAKAAPAPAPEEADSIDWKAVGNKIVSTTKNVGSKVGTTVKNLDVKKIDKTYKSILPIIAAVMAVLCLIIGIIQTFGTYDVEMKITTSYKGETETESESGPIADFYEGIEDAEEVYESTGLSVVGILLCNILYGLFNFFLAIILILPFFGLTKIKFIRKSFNNFALVGFIGTLAYMILFAIFATGKMEMFGMKATITMGIHFTSWIAVILFAIETVFSHVLPRLKAKPAAEPAPVEAAE